MMDNREQAEGIVFLSKQDHGRAVPGPAEDPLTKLLENWRSESAGVPAELLTSPILSDPRRLRSERDDDEPGEEFQKFAAPTAAGRRLQAIHQYLKRKKAAHAPVDRTIAELLRALKGENS